MTTTGSCCCERADENHVVPFSLLTTFICSLTNSPGSTSSHNNPLQLAAAARRLKNEARATRKLWGARDDNVRAYGGGSVCRKDITRRGEQKRHLCHQKCVCEKVQHPLTQRASVCCGSKLSITLTSQGPFRTAVNRSATLPVAGLEAQDAPTTELHPASLRRCA